MNKIVLRKGPKNSYPNLYTAVFSAVIFDNLPFTTALL
jgi:hypothetical protein